MQDLTKDSLALELAMDNYRKSFFVLRSNVLKNPIDLSSNTNKESLRVSHASDVVMSVDGHHTGTNPELSQTTSSASTPSQVTSPSSSACDIALSFAHRDKKSAIILKQLLLEKIPSLKISEPTAGDFSRVQSLDVARVIVPLLSPAFLVSNELVEELNIAIYRNRSSSRRILFPIQISAIPPKPSYVHLIPCEFSSSDYKWASKIVSENLSDVVFQMAERYEMDVDEVFCLKEAADVISKCLLDESQQSLNLVNRVLLNVRETEDGWKKIRQALYEEEGLQRWKRAFGIEISSQEVELKPPRVIQQDGGELDVDTAAERERNEMKTMRFEGERTDDGVELDLDVIKNAGQEAGEEIAARSQSLEHERGPSPSTSKPVTADSSVESKNEGDLGRRRRQSSACFLL